MDRRMPISLLRETSMLANKIHQGFFGYTELYNFLEPYIQGSLP